MSDRQKQSLAELHNDLCLYIGVEAVARTLVPDLVRSGNSLRADSLRGNTAEGPRQAFSIILTGEHRGRWRDFGQDVGGDLIDLIEYTRRTTKRDAARYARGLLDSPSRPKPVISESAGAARSAADEAEAIRMANRMWTSAQPITGSPGARYLTEARALTYHAPDVVRYHPTLWHGPSGVRYPAILAKLVFPDSGEFRGVLRLYLDPDAPAKARIDKPRSMRGPVAGAACILGPEHPRVVLCEGLETGLSIQEAFRDQLCVLAAGSQSNIRAARLPSFARELIDARDGNIPDSISDHTAQRITKALHAHGLPVRTVSPPKGWDFNDLHRHAGLDAVRALIEGRRP